MCSNYPFGNTGVTLCMDVMCPVVAVISGQAFVDYFLSNLFIFAKDANAMQINFWLHDCLIFTNDFIVTGSCFCCFLCKLTTVVYTMNVK